MTAYYVFATASTVLGILAILSTIGTDVASAAEHRTAGPVDEGRAVDVRQGSRADSEAAQVKVHKGDGDMEYESTSCDDPQGLPS